LVSLGKVRLRQVLLVCAPMARAGEGCLSERGQHASQRCALTDCSCTVAVALEWRPCPWQHKPVDLRGCPVTLATSQSADQQDDSSQMLYARPERRPKPCVDTQSVRVLTFPIGIPTIPQCIEVVCTRILHDVDDNDEPRQQQQ